MRVETGTPSAHASLVRELRWALYRLYDPASLAKSALIGALGLDPASGAASLRRTLTRAIDALKPDADASPHSSAWRTYQILYHRYVDQLSQIQVAMSLGLSVRQLRRQDSLALHVLADHIASHYDLHLDALTGQSGAGEGPAAAAPSVEQELDWLRQTQPSEVTEATQLVESLVAVLAPLARERKVRIESMVPEGFPRLAVQVATIRQGLLSILTTAIRSVPGGVVRLVAEAGAGRVRLQVLPEHPSGCRRQEGGAGLENLDILRHLVQLSGGTLTVRPGATLAQPFAAELTLSAMEQAAVLVIDDNADTLQLFQRYLAGTRYPFVGARDPQAALALAAEVAPKVILLDVMLPGIDGWELLGRLREHPTTRDVPVIVCSILQQEQLASALGAAAFLPKPVTRPALLEALDRQLAQP